MTNETYYRRDGAIVEYQVRRIRSYLVGDRISQVLAEITLGHTYTRTNSITVDFMKVGALTDHYVYTFFIHEIPAKSRESIHEYLSCRRSAKFTSKED